MIESVLFYILAALVIGLSLVVVTRTNPMSAALALVAMFAVLAGLYGVLEASFVAVLQILVYAGGIIVLLIFVLMMLNLRKKELKLLRANFPFIILTLAAVLGGALSPVIFSLIRLDSPWAGTLMASVPGFGGIRPVADLLFSNALLAFEVLSLLLMAALVGALVLTKRKL